MLGILIVVVDIDRWVPGLIRIMGFVYQFFHLVPFLFPLGSFMKLSLMMTLCDVSNFLLLKIELIWLILFMNVLILEMIVVMNVLILEMIVVPSI